MELSLFLEETAVLEFFIFIFAIFILQKIIRALSPAQKKKYQHSKPTPFSRSEWKGLLEERRVNKTLQELDSSLYKIYHDIYIPAENHRTTQIDHIVTSPYGIFVIETKHYNGWIFGRERDKFWTQVIYKNRETFLNPIRQNYGHIKALVNYLELDDDNFHSIIAFSDQSTFKFNEVFKMARVVYYSQLIPVIKEFQETVIDSESLEKINHKLDLLVIKDSIKKRNMRAEHIHMNHSSTEPKKGHDKIIPLFEERCPRCHASIVKKENKYGVFWGCSNFPACGYKKDVK